MKRGYFARLKERISSRKRQKRQEQTDLLKKYQKPTTIHSQQIYGESWKQLNKNLRESGHDAKITKDGTLRIDKNIYQVKRDLEKNTSNAVREIVGYFKENEGLDARKTKDVQRMQELYGKISSGMEKSKPTIKSQGPVMYGRKHENQLNVNLEDLNAKYEDGKLTVGKNTYQIKGNLEANTKNTLKEIAFDIIKNEGFKKKDLSKARIRYNQVYDQISTDMLTPRRVAPPKSLENITMAALAGISVLLLLPQNEITGNAINQISHQTNQLGLIFCLLGIIGLAFTKVYRKHKTLKEIK